MPMLIGLQAITPTPSTSCEDVGMVEICALYREDLHVRDLGNLGGAKSVTMYDLIEY